MISGHKIIQVRMILIMILPAIGELLTTALPRPGVETGTLTLQQATLQAKIPIVSGASLRKPKARGQHRIAIQAATREAIFQERFLANMKMPQKAKHRA